MMVEVRQDVVLDKNHVDLQAVEYLMEAQRIQEVTDILKEHGMSPYYFIGHAAVACVVEKSTAKALRYVRYAMTFINSWFTNYQEESAFHSTVMMTEMFIAMYYRYQKDEVKVQDKNT
jgi:N-acetylglucosamine-6-phosphate deacetylase